MKIFYVEAWDDPIDATCIVCGGPTVGWAKGVGVRWWFLPCGCCSQTNEPRVLPQPLVALALLMMDNR